MGWPSVVGPAREPLLARRALAVMRLAQRSEVAPLEPEVRPKPHALDMVDFVGCRPATRMFALRIRGEEPGAQLPPAGIIAAL